MSVLPIIDKSEVVAIYFKYDIINPTAKKAYNNLDTIVIQVFQHCSQYFKCLVKCSKLDILKTIILCIGS